MHRWLQLVLRRPRTLLIEAGADASGHGPPIQARLAALPDLPAPAPDVVPVAPPRPPAPRRRRRRRSRRARRLHRLLLLIAGLLILLGLAVPAAAIYYVCYTESGLQLIASWVPHQIGDIEVELGGVKGTIAHGMSIGRVDVDERLVHVHIEGLKGSVLLAPLLLQTVRSGDTFAQRVVVTVKPHPKPPRKRSPPSFLPRWLIVNLAHTRIAKATVVLTNGIPLVGTDLVTSASLHHSFIRFFRAELQHEDNHLTFTGLLRAADPLKLELDGRLDWAPQEQAAWLFAITAQGDLNSLALNVHTLRPFRSDFSGRMLSLINTRRWRWLGNAVVKDLDLAAWHAGGLLGIIDGQLHLQGDRHGFLAQGTATPQGLHAGLFDVLFQGYYQNHVLTAERMEARHRGSGSLATGHGTFGIVRHGPLLDIQGTWQDLRWPLVGDAPFKNSAANFTINGIMPYHVTAQGVGKIAELPPWPMKIEGTLGKTGFTLDHGEVELYGGHGQAHGEVTWSGGQSWTLESEVRNLSLGEVRPDLPGRINFAISGHGSSFAANQDLDIAIRDLSGSVRGAQAHGSGRMTRTRGTWEFENVYATLGKTRLSLDGIIAQTMDLRFSVAAEDLSLISPDSRGLIRADGRLGGTPDLPILKAKVQGTGIQHQGITLDDVAASIDLDVHPHYDSAVDIKLRNLRYKQRTLDSLTLSLRGRPESYALRSEARAEGLDATATATASYVRGQLAGVLDSLKVSSRDLLHLTLSRPVGLRASADHARLERLCLEGRPASLCAAAEWTPREWSTELTASALPIQSLTSGLSASSITYDGQVEVQAHVGASGSEPVQGSMQAQISNAQLVHKLLSGRVDHTPLGSGTIELKATKTDVSATASLTDGKIGTLHAAVVAQRNAPRWQDMPITTGRLEAQTSQLNLLSLYLPDIDRAAGRLTANAALTGTLGEPHLSGSLNVAGAEVDLYQVNLRLRQLQLDARLTDTGISFNGVAGIGSGSVNAVGQLEWRDSLPYGQLALHGSSLRVVDIPEAHIDASPDLQFKINGHRIEVGGSVDVPYARIMPRDLGSAVRASSDEVLVGSQEQDRTKRTEIVSSIRLRLGDKVNIITSGLTARLQGDLDVRSGEDATTRATGQLKVVEGKYAAYAHNFDIQNGTLIFTGGPVDNPGIAIKAARKFPDVTAGVNVRGTLMQPRVSFFSEPSLPQSEIVSLILSGGSLESAQNRDRTGGAGNEALVQGGAVLLQQLGSPLGIEDVGVQSDRYNTNDTSLVLGKYLSPRLYVSYGVSLTEQLQVLKLRYSLGDHWTVKTEVGQARGADLEFSIDR